MDKIQTYVQLTNTPSSNVTINNIINNQGPISKGCHLAYKSSVVTIEKKNDQITNTNNTLQLVHHNIVIE